LRANEAAKVSASVKAAKAIVCPLIAFLSVLPVIVFWMV
jgi:hypothetical protein